MRYKCLVKRATGQARKAATDQARTRRESMPSARSPRTPTGSPRRVRSVMWPKRTATRRCSSSRAGPRRRP